MSTSHIDIERRLVLLRQNRIRSSCRLTVIANTAVDGLVVAVYASVRRLELARRRVKLNVIRYADDFV